MTPEDLTKIWRENFAVEPRAHQLKTACRQRWLRIHSLPDLKRYPETPEEYSLLLHRHNTVISALIPSGAKPIYICALDPNQIVAGMWHWTAIPIDAGDKDSGNWHLYAKELEWQTAILDTELRSAADWRSVNQIIFGIEQRIAYHPYDGGADIIARDSHHRDELRARFCDWLSPLPSGL